jgi:pyruvate dehydrogenase E2 component (dihydrolipoamide acetyltransferase)
MPIEVIMPKVDMDMASGTIATWHVAEGAVVTKGMPIFDIETDKATMEIEAQDAGILRQIVAKKGDVVAIGKTVAWLYAEGEAASAPGAPPVAAPASAAPTVAATMTVAAPTAALPAAAPTGTVRATPLARRLAKTAGLTLGAIMGTGPRGRISRRDVDTALTTVIVPANAGASPTAQAISPPTVQAAKTDEAVLALFEPGSFDVLPHDGMRRIIARRLTESKTTIPHFYLTVDCRLDDLLIAREKLNTRAAKDGAAAYKLSVNDFLIKALALALRDVPAANATWTEAGMLRHKRIDVGVAVSVDGGLFTPILRHADLKTLGELSNEIKDLAARARVRKLTPQEYQGGTTSISNLGMFGIKKFDAVINPPHATILAVGAGERQPTVIDDKLAIATVMSATLSCDHRVVDGTLGAAVLQAFKSYVEDPVRMLA